MKLRSVFVGIELLESLPMLQDAVPREPPSQLPDRRTGS